MKFLNTYRPIWIQGVLFISLGIYKHQFYLPIIGFGILCFPLFSGKLAVSYIKVLEAVLNRIGIMIKNLLFAMLYFFVFTPIAFLRKSGGSDKDIGFVETDRTYDSSTFSKMW